MRNTRNMLLATMGVALRRDDGGAAGAGAGRRAGRQDLRDEAVAPPPSTTPSTNGSSASRRWSKRIPAAASRPRSIRRASSAPIPRQIEGVQFGSIQGWMGPPEFLVGVDERYEALSAPGLFSSIDQVMKVIAGSADPEDDVRHRRAKGLEGIGFAPIGPSSIMTKKAGQDARRPQGHEDPRAGVAVPARADPPHGRLADRHDAGRRAAGHPAGHHRRHAGDHDRSTPRCSTTTPASTWSRTTSPT